MTKVFNRAIKLGGHERNINDVDVQVLEYDGDTNVLLCSGTTVPTADSSGFAKGCLFIKTDAADGTKGLYENQGTSSECDFNLVGAISEAEISLDDGDILVGNASDVAAGVTVSGDITLTRAGVASVNWGTSGTPIAHTDNGDEIFSVHATNSDTSGNYEPVSFNTTVSAAGMTGGRVKAALTIDDAMGSWSNALKADVTYGASGSTTGLGSAFVAEMTLSAGTSAGTYAPLEVELNVPSGASLGTRTAMGYFSVQGDDVATFDSNGYLFSINGLTEASGKVFQANTAADATHALRIDIGGTDYFIMLTNSGA